MLIFSKQKLDEYISKREDSEFLRFISKGWSTACDGQPVTGYESDLQCKGTDGKIYEVSRIWCEEVKENE